MRNRAISSFRRCGRIAFLTKCNKQARNLVSTGAFPQAAWGQQILGTPPAAMSRIRSTLVTALGVKTGGRCCTTAIQILAPKLDPKVTLPLQMVTAFLVFWAGLPQDLRSQIRSAWGPILRAHSPDPTWSRVTGPLSALVCTLREAGWVPAAPDSWIDHEGSKWNYVEGPITPLIDHLRAHLERIQWTRASQGHLGTGLQHGVTMYGFRKLWHSQSDEDKGVLLAVAANSCWTRSRLHKAGYLISPACPLCGANEEDEYHRYWTCPTANSSGHPDVVASEHLCNLAEAGVRTASCFWLRALVPTPLNPCPPPLDAYQWSLTGSWDDLPADVQFFTDGSGGRSTSDPRARRCGSGVVACVPGDPPRVVASASSALGGSRQTVPRAELHALTYLVQKVPGTLPIAAFVDCKAVVNGFNKGENKCMAHTTMPDLWAEFWQAFRNRSASTTVTWIPSHATQQQVDSGLITAFQLFGNSEADSRAGAGAEAHQISDHTLQALADLDERQTCIARRLVAIAKMHIEKAPYPDIARAPRVSGWDTNNRVLELTSHLPVRRPNCWTCALCGVRTRRKCLARSPFVRPCPGSRPVLFEFSGEQHRAAVATLLAKCHPTHRLDHCRGVLLCTLCGGYTSSNVQSLSGPCKRFATSSGMAAIKRWSQGLPPGYRLKWPIQNRWEASTARPTARTVVLEDDSGSD